MIVVRNAAVAGRVAVDNGLLRYDPVKTADWLANQFGPRPTSHAVGVKLLLQEGKAFIKELVEVFFRDSVNRAMRQQIPMQWRCSTGNSGNKPISRKMTKLTKVNRTMKTILAGRFMFYLAPEESWKLGEPIWQ